MNEPNDLAEHPCCTVCGIPLQFDTTVIHLVPTMYVFKTTCEHGEIAIFDLDGNKVVQKKETK